LQLLSRLDWDHGFQTFFHQGKIFLMASNRKPAVLKGLPGCQALLRVDFKQFSNELFAIEGSVVENT